MISVDDAMSKILWPSYFIEVQEFKIEQNKLMQDNKSAILLENNGKFSIYKSTKYIKTRYFFVKYRVAQGGI